MIAPKAIIFDLVEVLFKIDRLSVVRILGFYDVAWYYAVRKKNPLVGGLELLDSMRREYPGEEQHTLSHRGYYLPACIYKWQCGLVNKAYVVEKIRDYVEELDRANYFISPREKQLLINLTGVMANAHGNKGYLKPIQSNVRLTQQLRNSKQYKLFILTNMDEVALSKIKHIYSDVFKIFDGVFASCEAGSVKPESVIYTDFLKQFDLQANSCFFIDDQQDNVVAAQNLGIRSDLCQKPYALPHILRKHNFFV